ncbi:hypothetical protein ABZX40_14950 [Streptomyces sp. NPDC004610]|uniref:hypothetical protein n=1 Tax=unclassified Streptomyces TaxID=2593676 RepID=UPI0033A8C8F0
MPDRETLTGSYLDLIGGKGVPAAELLARVPESELLTSYFTGDHHSRFLPRPVFLDARDVARLTADLEHLHTALTGLPDRLYGGDIEAFARDVGMTEDQTEAIVRSRSGNGGGAVSRQGRADLYLDASGFRLLELNLNSALGGRDNAEMCRALLAHPLLDEFATRHGLGHVDTMREEIRNLLAETGLTAADRPVVAMVDWPSSYEELAPFLERYCARLRELGLDAYPCHIGQLRYGEDRVWLGERPVDVVLRTFLAEDLLESADAPARMRPLLNAVAAGRVRMFSPLDSELFASKGALAMLSDERNRHLLTPAELASVDRLLPWTRAVRRGETALEDGRRVDLLGYALTHRDDLVLKPTSLHGGAGIVLGWEERTTPEVWREHLHAALDGGYVIQRRVRPEPELFPDADGRLVPWVVVWGVFTGAHGFAGAACRATRADADSTVVNVAGGAAYVAALYPVPAPSD